jgi:hypothetical protein
MWTLPVAWYFPIMGPFPVTIIHDYVWRNFLLEISTPSEWIFVFASAVITLAWFATHPCPRVSIFTPRRITTARYLASFLLGVMGLHLLFSGLASVPGAFFAPTYDPFTDVMAGCVSLSGAFILVKWQRIASYKRGKSLSSY